MSDRSRRFEALVFAGKTSALRWRRSAQNLSRPLSRHSPGECLPVVASEVRAALYEGREPEMELGKAQNLRLVARRLNGVRVPAGATFSFWRQVGRCTRRRGFVRGREIRQGCVVPSVGGGICGLTNGLYEAALAAGLDVVERHPHTRVLPGSAAERGMDATVFWNHLDLRLRAPFEWQIDVELNRNELIVSIRTAEPIEKTSSRRARRPLNVVGDCADCGNEGCFRHRHRPRSLQARTAYWVDEVWPEFAAFVAERRERDLLFSPMANRAAYDWPGANRHAPFLTTYYALRLRRLADQGAARQREAMRRASGATIRSDDPL